MKRIKLNRIKEVGRKTVADFVHSESGSVGVKNAAIIGAFAAALTLSQSLAEATTSTSTTTSTTTNPNGSVTTAV